MSVNTLGKQTALLTTHGTRMGLTHPDANGFCAELLDGWPIGGMSGLQYQSGKNSITALAGGGQSTLSSITLTQMVNLITTIATTSDSVMLPVTAGNMPSSGGALQVTVINKTSLAGAVFPSSGDQINSLGANASFAIASSTVTLFYCLSSGQWYTK